MMEKLCAFCVHFDWEKVGYTYWGTCTGGYISGGASCRKSHFFEINPDDTDDVRTLFLTAEKCPDYTPAK